MQLLNFDAISIIKMMYDKRKIKIYGYCLTILFLNDPIFLC